MTGLYFLLRHWRPATVGKVFGKLQLASAAYMGFSHGTNDAQKTMGIIALALVAAMRVSVTMPMVFWASLVPWLKLIQAALTSWHLAKSPRSRAGRQRCTAASSSPIRPKPRSKPSAGETIIGKITFGQRPACP